MNTSPLRAPKIIVMLAILAILVTGAIHFKDAPDAYGDAHYKGVLFALNGVGALIAALGIGLGARSWGWGLGLLIAAGSIVGYVASRTVGLPGLPAEPDAWLEPLGVLSLIAEGIFTALAIWVLSRGHSAAESTSR